MTTLPLWLIPALPLAGFLVNGLLGKSLGKSFVSGGRRRIGRRWRRRPPRRGSLPYLAGDHAPIVERVGEWIRAGDFSAEIAFRLDPLSALMIGFVTFVAFLIHVYSIGYMHHEATDAGYARFFAYLNLFMFSMLTLVLAQNLLLLFVGWEGVGLCSYLLIGYYYDKPFAARGRQEGFRRQPHRRLGLPARHVRAGLPVRLARLRPGPRRARPRTPAGTPRSSRSICPVPLPRRGRQERPGASLRLASRRDGRPDAGVRADPCRDDGHGGRLHGHAVQRALPPRSRRDGGRRRRRLHDGAASRR